MSIRERIIDAHILFSVNRPDGALLPVFAAIGATSRRRRPAGTVSQRNPKEKMGDGEAFELFLTDELPKVIRVQNYLIKYRGVSHRVEHIFYKWFRCELAHDATLPNDIHFGSEASLRTLGTSIAADESLTLTHGWFFALVQTVVNAPENADHFGSPPQQPLPINVSNTGLTINAVEDAAIR